MLSLSPSTAQSGWQQLLLAAASPKPGGASKTAETPLLFPLCWSLNFKPRLPSPAHSGTSSLSPHPALPGR